MGLSQWASQGGRAQKGCNLFALAWRAEFTDSVPHSLIHLSDFSLIHSFANSFTHFPHTLYTHYIHSSVHTHPYTRLHLLCACKTLCNLRDRIAALARATHPPCGQLTGVRAWGPKKLWGRGRHVRSPGIGNLVLGGLSLPQAHTRGPECIGASGRRRNACSDHGGGQGSRPRK